MIYLSSAAVKMYQNFMEGYSDLNCHHKCYCTLCEPFRAKGVGIQPPLAASLESNSPGFVSTYPPNKKSKSNWWQGNSTKKVSNPNNVQIAQLWHKKERMTTNQGFMTNQVWTLVQDPV